MLSYAALNNYLKINYDNNQWLYDQFRGVDPFYDKVVMNAGSGRRSGESVVYPVAVGRTTSVSDVFKAAQDSAKTTDLTNQRVKFTVPFDKDIFSVGRISKKADYSSRDSMGAYVKAIEDETMQVIGSLKSKISADMWRKGDGVIGELNAQSAGNSGAIVLSSYADLWYWEVGMEFVIPGTYGTRRRVTNVNEKTRTITYTPALSSNLAKGVKLYFPATTTAGAGTFDGVGSIITSDATALASPYRGVTRNIHPTRLAGWREVATAKSTSNPRPITQAIRKAIVKISSFNRNVEGKAGNIPEDVYLSSAAWEALADEYDQRTQMRRTQTEALKRGIQGFTALTVLAGGKDVNVWACPGLHPTTGFVLDTKVWQLNWMGESDKTPVVFQKMTNDTYFRDVEGEPQIEFRIQLHPVLICKAPALNAELDLSAVTEIGNYLS